MCDVIPATWYEKEYIIPQLKIDYGNMVVIAIFSELTGLLRRLFKHINSNHCFASSLLKKIAEVGQFFIPFRFVISLLSTV
ncbi:hypothetical protein D3C85_1153860 [compost metagenome]